MASFRFFHAADIHLDSPLRGLSRYEGVPVDQIRLASRAALDNLVDSAVSEGVAFVVIAGDLYDGEWEDVATGLFFCAAMGRLGQAGIEVFLLYGNHDAASVITRTLPLPKNVRVFSSRKAETLFHASTGTALHGQSYPSRDPGRDLAAGYPDPIRGVFNIGVLHTALSGSRPPHAPYAPCTPQQLAAKGYQYWALGHVHEHEIVATEPHIVFPGNLQGRHIREIGAKGAVIVDVVDDAVDAVRHLPLDAVRWARVDVDLTGCLDDDQAHAQVRAALQTVKVEAADDRPLMVRVTYVGETPLHRTLNERRAELRDVTRALGLAVSDQIWIEKVEVKTTAETTTDATASPLLSDVATFLREGLKDPELSDQIRADLADFLNRTPQEIFAESDFLRGVRDGDLSAMLVDAAVALQARLAEGARDAIR
jgi:DNA repair exonuclease SbcCD nuclease subunit